jgi:eukaryotic-like serine/threonine-protein kinase
MHTLRAYDPSSVGPFRLLGRLGGDGLGQVYLGEGPGERWVTVKVVHPGIAHDEQFRARFARAVDLGARMTAPWTAAVVDADPDAPQPWLATEYVPGPSLDQAVAGTGVLPPDAVHLLALRLAQALAGMHGAGLLHGDVKPSNVQLAADGPRLIDFGIAQAVDGTRMTSTGMTDGSAFMSPEQADGAEIGPASDVFSLGAVIVFAAVGRAPADFGTLNEPVRGLVARCLAREPADRPTAAELVAALGPEPAPRAEGGLPPAAAALPPRYAGAAARPVPIPPEAARPPTEPALPPAEGLPAKGTSRGGRIGRRALLTAVALVGLGGVGAAAAGYWPMRPQPAVRWTYTAGGAVLAIVTDGATVFAKGANSAVSAIDAATGQARWTHELGQPLDEGAGSLVVTGPTVYTSDGLSTYAIDAASGSRRWVADTGDLLAADPTTVLCTGVDQQRRRIVTAVDPATGDRRWTGRLEDIGLGAGSPPELAALSGGGAHLVGGGTLVTLDHSTGATLWSRPVTGDAVAGGLVATPDSLFLTDPSSNSSTPPPVLALDVRTGDERWIVEGSTDPDFAPRLVDGGVVYSIGSAEVAAFEVPTGRQRWTWSDEEERNEPLAPDNAWNLSGPAAVGDTLVVLADTTPAGSRDSHQCVVIALDTGSGTSRWRLELPPLVLAPTEATFLKAGPVATADGSVVVSVGPELYAITA